MQIIFDCPKCGQENSISMEQEKSFGNEEKTFCSFALHQLPNFKLNCSCFTETEILTANLLMEFRK
jgi:hypothetical protein